MGARIAAALALALALLALPSPARAQAPRLPSARPARLANMSAAPTAPAVDTFTFLDNGVIRLGIDMTRGGTIGWLGPSAQPALSLLNVHDFGRVVQGSFYSGPNPFNPDGKCSEPGGWGQPWPWNPIGAGDVYNHAAPVLNVTVAPDNASASVFTQPMQWACDSVPCDCVFEQRIRLVGAAAEVTLTMHTARADATFYAGQTQELPAVYVTGEYCHLFTYNGSKPFAGDALAEQPAVWGVNAWDAFTSGERWMAFVNSSGFGVGVVSPFVAHFGAGFYNNGVIGTFNCTPNTLGPYDSQTGYIAPWGAEIIDAHAPYVYDFALVLGTLATIRTYAATAHAAGRDEPLTPSYDFVARNNRGHCIYGDAQDQGLPVGLRGLELNVTGPHPSVIGPLSVWQPSAAPRVLVNASFATSLAGARSSLAWQRFGDDAPCAACHLEVAAVADGAFHLQAFDVASVPKWADAAALVRLIWQPLGAAPVDPSVYYKSLVAVASIVAA